MSENAIPSPNTQVKGLTAVELDDEQLDAISGGGYIDGTEQYVCDTCGTMAEYLGTNHNCILFFRCPSCGQYYQAY